MADNKLISKAAMAVVTPKMKSYIWLETVDGFIQQVEEEVAMFSPVIRDKILKTNMGYSKAYAISLPERVDPATFGLILDYCRFHLLPGHSTKEHKTFDEKFIRVDLNTLYDLTCAAYDLQLKPLFDLCTKAVAWICEGSTPEHIREIFSLPDDLTEEEKLAPIKNSDDYPRIRLLNRLYAKKRQELKETHKLKNVEVVGETKDERSVDDLLSFINGADGGAKGTRANKKKKKGKRKKDNAKVPQETATENPNEESNLLLECHNANFDIALESSSSKHSSIQDLSAVKFSSPNLEFMDDDLDDGPDPVLKEEVDREIEDFERRLKTNWHDRLREVLCLSQDSKLLSGPMNGNGSRHFNTKKG